jgi:uncharacterized protein (DUF1330 family)
MAAYYIALAGEVPEDWWELMRPYTGQVEAIMARYGGFYRTWPRHRVEVVEGAFGPHLGATIVEFPTFAQLRAWYDSPEDAPQSAAPAAHALRRHAGRRVERLGPLGWCARSPSRSRGGRPAPASPARPTPPPTPARARRPKSWDERMSLPRPLKHAALNIDNEGKAGHTAGARLNQVMVSAAVGEPRPSSAQWRHASLYGYQTL